MNNNAWKVLMEEQSEDLVDRYKKGNSDEPVAKRVVQPSHRVYEAPKPAETKDDFEDIILKEFARQSFTAPKETSKPAFTEVKAVEEKATYEEPKIESVEAPKVEARKIQDFKSSSKFLTTTLASLSQPFSIVGIVSGSSVYLYDAINEFSGKVKAFYNKEKSDYGTFLDDVRTECEEKMKEKAISLGANACIGVTFQTNDVMGEFIEFVCFGTAVKF